MKRKEPSSNSDLFALSLKGDNVRQFVNQWNATLNNLQTVPDDTTLECLFRTQLEKSTQFKEMMTLIDQDIVHRGEKKSYKTLMHSVQAHLEHRHIDTLSKAMRQVVRIVFLLYSS